jgi:hypothetical protein
MVDLVHRIITDKKDLLSFRDIGYKSIITGQQAKTGNKKWIEILDSESP